MAYVDVKSVGKDFVGRDGVFTALEDVRFEVEEGEFVSLIGHSGCGKSTILNLVAGLLPMTRGEIRVRGERVQGPGPDRMVVFQNHSLLPWLTLRKNIALAVDRVHRKKTATERAEIVEAHLAMVHLTKAADRLPSEVSGGMKQRCGIARALSTRPKVLLLDEPFGALDALTRANLQDELLRIWERERITVMMITHDVEEALLLSDRIVMMSNGPSAHVAEIMKVELPRPRNRIRMVHHPSYYRQRGELLQFLNKCKKEKAQKTTTVVSLPAGPAPLLASGVEKEEIVVGFVPLLDCAPFAVAEGLFEKHRLRVTLSRERSWKAISDGVREGRLDAGQMVAGMPFADALGMGGRAPFATTTAMTLSRGGNAITFGNVLRDAGVVDCESLKRYTDERRAASKAAPVFGMVHQASMHNLLLRAWLAAGGIDPDADVTLSVIPPPQMVANLEEGNIAAYCVGEPWNTRAVQNELGFVCATDDEIWAAHPEKVLGVSRAWAEHYPKTHLALVSALLEACALCDDPDFRREKLPSILAERTYVGGAAADFAPCLTGPYDYGGGRSEVLPNLVRFSNDGANLCRTNEVLWILAQFARWGLLAFPKDPDALLSSVYLETVLREAADATNIKVGPQDLSPLRIAGGRAFDPKTPLSYFESLEIRRELAPALATAALQTALVTP